MRLLACTVFLTISLGLVLPISAVASTNPVVRVVTDQGHFDMVLYHKQAPASVANFLRLVDAGFYEGLIFHRVIANFMVQAGGFDAQLNPRESRETVVNESFNGLSNAKMSVALARYDDPDSAGSEFFINVSDNEQLNAQPGQPGYTVFGQVIAGWPVVEIIELANTHIRGGLSAVPEEPVTILRIERIAAADTSP